jgi:putative membrane protein
MLLKIIRTFIALFAFNTTEKMSSTTETKTNLRQRNARVKVAAGEGDDRTIPRLTKTMNAPLAIRSRFQSFLSGKSKQPEYNARDWLRTVIFASKNVRGFENIRNPWLCVQLVTVLWVLLTKIIEPKPLKNFSEQLSKVESVYLIMFSTLGFLIVFRLTRAAVRFWDCRSAWGNMVIYSRCLADALMVRAEEVEMDCNKSEEVTREIVRACDDCVAWCAAFAVSSKQFLRGIDALPKEELLGVLSEEDVNKLQKAPHQPLFCYAMMRRCASRIYVTYRHSEKSEMREMHETIRDESGRSELSKYLEGLITQEGALERLRATKLPQIYVTHLRTFLILYCFSIPFVYALNWGWATIPATAIATFALMGVEGAAMECEIPFEANRSNHLRMDQYCETIVNSCALLTQWGGDENAKKDINGGRRELITEESIDEECERMIVVAAAAERANEAGVYDGRPSATTSTSIHETTREEMNRRLSISKDHIALDVFNTTTTTTATADGASVDSAAFNIERSGSAMSGISLTPQNELTSQSLENIAETLKTG